MVEEAYALNVPLLFTEVKAQCGLTSGLELFFKVDRAGAVIEAVKVAEVGGALILRLYEAEGARGPLTLSTSLPVHKAWLTDLLEKEIEELPLRDGKVVLNLQPFEIVTLKFSL